jgi:hypothetical protein
MSHDPVTITATMDDDCAWELAQFCKRSTFQTFYNKTEPHLPEAERTALAYRMIRGIEAVQAALAEQGYSPR